MAGLAHLRAGGLVYGLIHLLTVAARALLLGEVAGLAHLKAGGLVHELIHLLLKPQKDRFQYEREEF